ncbi:MAG: hypothetical protein IIT58_10700 [Treponema sp.]|nr:hypothetical protein [Treponema sp.]
MTKEEFIAKHGEEAWERKLKANREHYARVKDDPETKEKQRKSYAQHKDYMRNWMRDHRDEQNEIRKNRYKKASQDPEFRKVKAEKVANFRKTFKESMGDCGLFTANQISTYTKLHIKDWKQYTKDLLDNEKCPEMLDIDYLYEHFKDNVEHDLFYGNVNILKFLAPLLCIKIYDGVEFNEKEIEMIKYFENFKNTLKKRTLKYNSTLVFVAPEMKDDIDKCTKCMLVYNLLADFMLNRTKYPTDKKLY